MGWPDCDWCAAPADVIDNYDAFRCWECWDGGGRDKPHNLVIWVLRNRDEGGPTDAAEAAVTNER